MLTEEYRKLECILGLLKNITTIKKIEIRYVNNINGNDETLVFSSNTDILTVLNEMIENAEIRGYRIYFEKYFISHTIFYRGVDKDIWNLGGIYIDSDYTLILSFNRLIEELSDFDDFRIRSAPIEGKKGYFDD